MLARTTRHLFSALKLASSQKRFYADKKRITVDLDFETKSFLSQQRSYSLFAYTDYFCDKLEAEKNRLRVIATCIHPFRRALQGSNQCFLHPTHYLRKKLPAWSDVHSNEAIYAATNYDAFQNQFSQDLIQPTKNDDYAGAKLYKAFDDYLFQGKCVKPVESGIEHHDDFKQMLFRYLIHCNSSFLLARLLHKDPLALTNDYIYAFIAIHENAARTLFDFIDLNQAVYAKTERFAGHITPLIAILLSEKIFTKSALHLNKLLIQNGANPDVPCRFQLNSGKTFYVSARQLGERLEMNLSGDLSAHMAEITHTYDENKNGAEIKRIKI